MEHSIVAEYRDFAMEAEDYRSLSDQERRIFLQRFIDVILYDPIKFKAMVKLINKWEQTKGD